MTSLGFGLKLSQNAAIDDLLRVWRIADDAGFDHCWVMDHFATLGPADDGVIFDAWTLQSAMAVATSHVRIGCMVTGNTYRHPGVLAKMAVTVDHLSDGRLEFGLGAGWAENEHTMYGFPFGSVGDRMDRLEEACQVIRSLWTLPRTTFDGTYYRFADAVAEPKPVQRPHPPVWIGGSGRRRTLRIAAQYADVWNAAGGTPEEIAELSKVLDAHCADVGRDPAEIRRTIQVRVPADPENLVATIEPYLAVGVTEFVLVLPGDASGVALAADTAATLPRLRNLG